MNGMGGYVGSAEDQRRILRQQKEREQQKQQFEEARKKASSAAGLRQFDSSVTESLENAFKAETVGLVTRNEFMEKRQTIAERMEAEQKRQRDAAEDAVDALYWKGREQKKAKAQRKHKLSFGYDDEEEEDEEDDQEKRGEEVRGIGGNASKNNKDTNKTNIEEDGNANNKNNNNDNNDDLHKEKKASKNPTLPLSATTNTRVGSRPYATLGKDPTVNADFLPDRDREREEERLREQLKKEWTDQQAALKAQPLDITYSYFNGTGHRNHITVTKGDTIGSFLKAVIEQLGPHFRELRNTSSSSLMYIKEDIILPHTMSFYELITKKAMGRTGPLFQFDLQEVTTAVYDPRIKSQDSHAGKVVERHWYSRNKHIFPYSKWEPFDSEKHLLTSTGVHQK